MAWHLGGAVLGVIGLSLSAPAFAQAPAPAGATPPPDLIYSRLKPCRVFDTTKTSRILANGVRSFLVSGSGNFAAQGGTAAGCGVPAAAQAVSLNLTAINGAAAGSLTASAYAQTTSAAVLRYPVSAPATAIGLVDLIASKITLRTTNTVNAIGDVTGYWTPPLWAALNPDGTTRAGPRVGSSSRHPVSSSLYFVRFDREISGCAVVASTHFIYDVGATVGNYPSSEVTVTVQYRDGVSEAQINVHVLC